MPSLLAYRPFIDPIELHELWFVLIVPLALFLSLAYKAVRVPDLSTLPRQVIIMTVQICFWMAALGLATYLFVQYVAPIIAPR
ncbi:MAG: hypothetical protein SFY69_07370 [Planctomycetota bacterium]|nr:hypothetical protein [Planctomycetota bacterium]